MSSQRVLVCGAGVAGSVLAFWLAEFGFQVVVVERSRADQKAGQGIEIEEPAMRVVELMGITDKLRAIRTEEAGFKLENEGHRTYATFGLGGFSPTGALELMRGDLTEVLYKAADEYPGVTYHFETTIESLRQTEDKVYADLVDRKTKIVKTEEFDFVVGADGVKSRTRQMVMGSPEQLNCYKHIGAYSAYFSIPETPEDWPYSRLCHFPGRRVSWIRPVKKGSGVTSVYIVCIRDKIPALSEANDSGDRRKQKEILAELFSGTGWDIPRVTEQMMDAGNFYSDELVQVKLDKWFQNRVALVGDAAWAPTPFTGEGNQLAIIGGLVLAQEMAKCRSPAAFDNYEKRLRAYVTNSQKIAFGGRMPKLVCPETRTGIWVLRMILGTISVAVGLYSLLGLHKLGLGRFLPVDKPDYSILEADDMEVVGAEKQS